MRIFLAGASGVVGRRLVPELLAAGHEVVGLARGQASADTITGLGAHAVLGDVYDAPGLAGAVAAARPDVVVHQLTDLAAGDRAANSRLRTVGTRNLVDAARAAGVRRMVAQSISWAYEPGAAPAAEGVPLDLHGAPDRVATVTGVADLETAVAELPEWVVLRYGTLYGPGTWYTAGGLMAQLAAAGRLPANADVTSFVHVDDAASAALAALTWPTGAVNVCDDDPAPGVEWVPVFCAAIGEPAPAPAEGERTGWARGADNRKARKELGWVPAWPSWRDGFAKA
ncbi:NAD(P)-dependent oxidoreductase [Amycolatopsis sp. FDAARGOS 1241]|uniref:NAD-dependent epimerase/dehydratase family protein n=1 Tax=Amycolatopsis sp. FDAARGOS 1241 TaxID=2778070 RepID=UPI0019507166|nr:NAD(P)-dependent oxidoreductase [Amycolatopsis sp. FDAARGOS 1241]QRP48505.1 NAD(P)-dependent oxidoreductase [Amycolatopsis sp. FDAARGOS 1241]